MAATLSRWTTCALFLGTLTLGCPPPGDDDDDSGEPTPASDAAVTGDASTSTDGSVADAAVTQDAAMAGDASPSTDGAVADASITLDGGVQPDGNVNVVDGGVGDASSPPDAGMQDGGGGTDAGFTWPVPTGPIPITPHESWKNRITPSDPFIVAAPFEQPDTPRWIKFSVLMRDPTKVYFQDSNLYAFHYEFARDHLDPFRNLTRVQFDQQSLHEQGQEVILGGVLFPANSNVHELGIQLVRQDPYHPEMVRIVFELVRGAIDVTTPTRAFYMPTFEQWDSARQHEPFFTQHDIPLSSADRWMPGNACYAPGWALGRLTHVTANQINAAYADGTLKPTDILVTDGVPAEVPFVAGILSLTPSTPNSHVAILAQSYNVPFAYVRDPAQQTEWLALAGKEVALRVEQSGGPCNLSVINVDGRLTEAHRAELLALKNPSPITLPPLAPLGSISANVDTLGPADITHFGGKAANYGLLRTTIADHVRPGIAFSFDLWSAFMDQPLISTGKTLRQSIADRLSPHTYPPNMAALQTDLSTIRGWIKSEASFTVDQKTAILAALSSFPADKKIRFRSSTNVEDSETFTGAGLYESFSGCKADDTDADTAGPSVCDPTETSERGVFRALQRVYASFYNDNAFLERLRHHVEESRAAMGVLVHLTFVDEDELANGVATVTDEAVDSKSVKLVTQLGAVSVTNPEGGAIPEVVDVSVYSFGSFASLRQNSSLTVLGATVLEWDADYLALADLIGQVSNRWATVTGKTRPFTLDLEYKKDRVEGLVIRQVRPLPRPSSEPSITTFMLPMDSQRCVFQGEAADVFGNHRLKSTWKITTEGRFLRDADLTETFYTHVDIDYLNGAAVTNLAGVPSALPGSGFELASDGTRDRFDLGTGRHLELSTAFTRVVAPRDVPLFTVDDAYQVANVTYDTPVPALDWNGVPSMRTNDMIVLSSCAHLRAVDSKDLPVHRTASGANGLSIDITFFHPPAPTGASAGYTAPLRHWDQTTITGLSIQPIVLRGYYSQTYRPGHHNFTEEFIFEPRLEEGISAATVEELNQRNVVAIYVSVSNDSGGDIRVIGTDGTIRPWQ